MTGIDYREGDPPPLRQQLSDILSAVADLGDDASVQNKALWERLDFVPVPVLLTNDASARDMRANLAGQRLFRTDRHRNLSQSSPDANRPHFQVFSKNKLVPIDELPMQRAASTGVAVEQSECELRFDDGTSIFILGHCIPLFDAAGKVRASLGAFIDITDRKRLERENSLLSEELAHRAKNTLAIIDSIARFTLQAHLSKEVYNDFSARLIAVGRVGDMLSRSNWRSASVEEAIRAALLPYVGHGFSRTTLSGPSIMVSAQAATSVSLAINELSTNATKYGALSVPDGLVSIQWDFLDTSSTLIVDWVESGGPPVLAPSRKGFGTKFLNTLLDTSSELRFDPIGVRCRLSVPAQKLGA